MTNNLFRLAGAALVTAGALALPAKAVDTITFTPTTVTRPNAANLNPGQAFPVDMESLNSTIPSSPAYTVRFTGLTLDAVGTGVFAGVTGTQRVNANANAFTVDYNDPSSATGIPNSFIRNLNADVSSFFLTGTCTVCGMSNIISITSLASSGDVQGAFTGLSTEGIPTSGAYSIFANNPLAFTFTGAGLAGTLSYDAVTLFTAASNSSTGSLTISAVPGPVPVMGAALAFGWSRKLRKRIKLAEPTAV